MGSEPEPNPITMCPISDSTFMAASTYGTRTRNNVCQFAATVVVYILVIFRRPDKIILTQQNRLLVEAY